MPIEVYDSNTNNRRLANRSSAIGYVLHAKLAKSSSVHVYTVRHHDEFLKACVLGC